MKRGTHAFATTLQALFIILSWLGSCFGVQPLAITVKGCRNTTRYRCVHSNAGTGDTTASRREIRLSRSLFADVFVVILCWIPSWIITILTRFNFTTNDVQLLCNFSLNFSNTINPLICAGMNPLFRREFRRIIFRKNGEKIGDTQQASTADATRRSNTFSPGSETGTWVRRFWVS